MEKEKLKAGSGSSLIVGHLVFQYLVLEHHHLAVSFLKSFYFLDTLSVWAGSASGFWFRQKTRQSSSSESSLRQKQKGTMQQTSSRLSSSAFCHYIKHFVMSLLNSLVFSWWETVNEDRRSRTGHPLIKYRLFISMLITRLISRKTHQEDCGYYKNLGLVIECQQMRSFFTACQW